MEHANVLCAAAVFQTHADFYSSYGNETRGVVVFDENCVDVLLEPITTTAKKWLAWVEMIRTWKQSAQIAPFLGLGNWLAKIEQEFLQATGADGKELKFLPYPVPQHLHTPGIKANPGLMKWLDSRAYRAAHRHVTNLYRAALHLLAAPDAYVLLERVKTGEGHIVNVRFRKSNPLPADKEVFILDATANEELVRALAPGWEIKVWECPPIEQQGRIIQIMDYDISRKRIKRELAINKPNNPSWLVQVLDFLLERYGPAALITFKKFIDKPGAEEDILGQLRFRDLILGLHNFPCRGHTFDAETLIVLGTPYKDQASVWELALALWGFSQLPRTQYAHRIRENGYFMAANMAYGEEHLRPIQDFLVTAELVQAVGRIWPTTTCCKG